jgi:osmotically-inducible protein OsmY
MHPQIDEGELERRVKLFLASTRPELRGLHIRAHGGTVRLAGQLTSFYLRQLALEATKRVAGVQSVVDTIQVPFMIGATEG